jgi:CRP-like cAMP-binding protein
MGQPGTCDIKSCFLCKYANPDWREVIALKKQTISFRKGEVIFNEGDKVNGLFFLYSGAVKVQKHWDDQKELIIRFSKPGDILGHRGLTTHARYPVSAIALAESKACFISNSFFETTLTVNPGLTHQLLHFYSAELQKAELRMRNLALADGKARIAETLLELLDTFGKDKARFIAVPVTRQDIAAYAGTTYETVFKFLKKLAADKTITTSGKSIRIIDENKLRKIVSTAN